MDEDIAHEAQQAQDGMVQDGNEMPQEGEAQSQPSEVEEEGGEVQPPRMVRAPGDPTKAEREEHEITHVPYRAWCEHCVKSRGKDGHHGRVPLEMAESTIPRVVMDYCFFQEDMKSEDETPLSLIVMIMVETVCHSVLGYAVESKTAGE